MRRNETRASLMEEEAAIQRALDALPPPTPPDGGWGWVVAFASFMMSAIVDGTCYSYGIVMPELQSHFASSMTIISLGGGLLLGTYMLLGPLASAVCNRLGCRRAAVMGSVVSMISMLMAIFSETGEVFIILFGLCSGVGFSLMFIAAVVAVGFYFEQHRPVAATIATCGSSVGAAFMGPLVTTLINEFGWKGTLLLISGLVFNGAVLGCLFRPLDADYKRRKKLFMRKMEEDKQIGPQTCIIMQRLLEEKRRQRTISTGSLNNGVITRDNMVIKPSEMHKFTIIDRIRATFSRSNLNLAGTSRVNSAQSSLAGTPAVQHKMFYLPNAAMVSLDGAPSPSPSTPSSPAVMRTRTLSSRSTTTPVSLHRQLFNSKLSNIVKNESSLSLHVPLKGCPTAPAAVGGSEFQSDKDLSADSTSLPDDSTSCEELVRRYRNVVPNSERPLYRKDIYYTGSVQNLPQYNPNIDEYVLSITAVPVPALSDEECCCYMLRWLPDSMLNVLRSKFGLSTLKSPTFILLALSSWLTMLGYYIPFLFLPLHASSAGIGAQSTAYLLTILGVANTIGRVICGVLSSYQWVNSLLVNNIALLIAGGATITLPFCDAFLLLAIYAAVFGICVAAFSSLRTVLLVELLGLDQLTRAFGQLFIVHGVAVMVGAPVAGFLYDKAGKSCSWLFYFSGGLILLSGVISWPLKKISEYEKHKKGVITPYDSSDEALKKKAMISSHDTYQ